MIYVLLEQTRSGCEADCLLEDVMCASISKETLIARKNKLEIEYNHFKEACAEYQRILRDRLKEVAGPPYIESSKKIQEEVGKLISDRYNLKMSEISYGYYPEISYEIKEVETI